MGPTAFGTGSASATTASGAAVGIFTTIGIVVPQGYVSSTSLGLSSSTYAGTTLALLVLTKDTYTWSWGSGATADSFTLVISQAPPVGVPEPATLALIGGRDARPRDGATPRRLTLGANSL